MSNTTNLVLPYLAEGQAQKHVTVNESLRKLDAIVQLAVESATTTAQPGSPTDGQCWIVPAGKTGANWAGFTNWAIAYYRDGVWEQITPREGWLAWVRDDEALLVFNGTDWDIVSGGSFGTAANEEIGVSGANVPLLNAVNTWGAAQAFAANKGIVVGPGHICYDLGARGMLISRNLYYDQGTSQYKVSSASRSGWSAIRILGDGVIQMASASGAVSADAVVSPTWRHLAKSGGGTGGTGSAGAGKQYVELNINGTTYKLLHDGTV